MFIIKNNGAHFYLHLNKILCFLKRILCFILNFLYKYNILIL